TAVAPITTGGSAEKTAEGAWVVARGEGRTARRDATRRGAVRCGGRRCWRLRVANCTPLRRRPPPSVLRPPLPVRGRLSLAAARRDAASRGFDLRSPLHCHHPTAVVGTNGSVVIKERIDIDYCDDSGDDHRRRSDDWEGAGAAAPGPGVAVRPSRKGLRLNDEGSFHQPPQEDRAEVERVPLLGRPTDEIAPASANIWEKSEPALLMAATTGQPIIISANTEQPLIISTPAEQPVIISCMHDKSPCHKAPSRNHAPGPSTCPIESKDPPPLEQSPPTKNEQNANDPAKDFVWETPKPLVLNVSNPKLRVSFARNLETESAAKSAVNDGQKASTHQSNTYPSSRVQYYYAMPQNSHDSIFSKEAQDASFPAGLQPTRLLTTTADARGAESTASAGMDIIRQITAYTVEPPRVILQQPARAPPLRDDTPLGKAVASKLSAPVTISAVGAEDDSTETSVELGSTSLGASASPPLSPDSASLKSDPCWDEPPVQFKVPSTGGMREGAAAAAADDSSLAVTLPPDDTTTTTSEESSVVSSGDRPVVRRVPHANLSRIFESCLKIQCCAEWVRGKAPSFQ
ncbi:Protein of unknown function, partial [Gryllus bimaculatus]